VGHIEQDRAKFVQFAYKENFEKMHKPCPMFYLGVKKSIMASFLHVIAFLYIHLAKYA